MLRDRKTKDGEPRSCLRSQMHGCQYVRAALHVAAEQRLLHGALHRW